MTADDCRTVLHDFGRGHGAFTPLAPGETQVCRLCGVTRWLTASGSLNYGRLRRKH